MAVGELSDEALVAALRAHPELRERVSSIVLAVEGGEGELREADAAEERMVEETRLLGREALKSWAERRVEATEREIRQGPRMHRQGEKKLRWHTKFGEIEVREPQYRFGTRRVRPFVLGAKVNPLGCSRPLQRAIVDFAADQPFAQARAKLEEHYGLAIGESTIQRITFAHAEAMHESHRRDLEFPETPGLSKPIVVETDGGMVPIVEPNREGKDKRKGKTLSWREAKLSLAHAQGSCTPVYAGSIEGGVEEAGRRLLCLTRFAPASGPTPGSTRSATAHPGSSAKSSSSSAIRAAT